MMKKRKIALYILLSLIAFVLFILLLLGVFIFMLSHSETYETNDIADYGNITGNYDNDTPREFIFSFFPEKLDNSFSDVVYHYKAKKFDAHAYEVFLDVTVDDPIAFTLFVGPYINDSAPFPYDQSFMEVTIAQELWLHRSSSDQNLLYIDYARIGKILYSESEQRVIFFALGVLDGGGTSTSELSYFADRFNIDWEKLETESN